MGVLVDIKLDINQQCALSIRKVNGILLPEGKRDALYSALVRPHVEYCVQAWGPQYNKDAELSEQVQRATRMIRGLDHLSSEERLRELG